MIIDSHTHIAKLEGTKFAESFEKNFDFFVKEMKESGVDKAIVITARIKEGDDMNPSVEKLLEIISSNNNLYAVGSINVLGYSQDDFNLFEEYIKTKKIVAVKMYLGYEPFYANDEACNPIYELCVKYDVPVIFHTGDTLNTSTVRARIKYAHPIHIDDVAVSYPKLKIIIAHLGNPWLRRAEFKLA
jgi:uncharacterized protein